MDIIISNTGGQPIYEQICRQVKGAIAAGKLKPGEPLPSIRALARDLRISVITTKRAYEELAAQDAELARESNLREIEEHLQAAVELSRQIELPAEELQHILQVLIEEE